MDDAVAKERAELLDRLIRGQGAEHYKCFAKMKNQRPITSD
jgi:hypothetical protein